MRSKKIFESAIQEKSKNILEKSTPIVLESQKNSDLDFFAFINPSKGKNKSEKKDTPEFSSFFTQDIKLSLAKEKNDSFEFFKTGRDSLKKTGIPGEEPKTKMGADSASINLLASNKNSNSYEVPNTA